MNEYITPKKLLHIVFQMLIDMNKSPTPGISETTLLIFLMLNKSFIFR